MPGRPTKQWACPYELTAAPLQGAVTGFDSQQVHHILETMKEVTCNKCGWVAFVVTREYAENQVKEFNAYFQSLSKYEQNTFYGGNRSSIADYEVCFRCGNAYKDFRPSVDGDCPDGCTLQPIIQD